MPGGAGRKFHLLSGLNVNNIRNIY